MPASILSRFRGQQLDLLHSCWGLITSSFPGIMYGPLYYHRLDMEKTKALSQCSDFEGTMELTSPVLDDINWWINNIPLSLYVIDHGEPHAILYTDASTYNVLRKKIRHQHLKLMVDNMTVVTVLNNMGTSHSWKLNELNKEIWS